ncbi:MAG: zinc ABC transporter substrate-binding protein [Rhodospirillaceae bacterium]|nr:zinc ABC transporter substrate-binding protein [Rhodospirillaceae bacterium]
MTRIAALALGILTLIAGFAALPVQARETPLTVVATTGMLTDTVAAVGGERVRVEGLMGPGVDPHGYRQTRSDIARMNRADLIVYHGLRLEAQLLPLLQDFARKKPVAALAEAIPASLLLTDPIYAQAVDPHVWMDPTLWRFVVEAARDRLTALDPEGASVYAANAQRYLDGLAETDRHIKETLHAIPQERRVLLTAHDAFRYFGRANGYEVIGIQGISTESQANLRRIEELVSLLVDRRIPAIFVESSVSDQNIRALIEGAAARGWRVRIGGELFSDAMGQPGTPEGTYMGMISHNAAVIANALKGDE